ncbi:hypothetical protein F5X99DRAFT_407948 [Biscogniauxia marginata]|nr:hypothetical protein F5X99DRAFT_407948 [Biscogniauxia marginata]
MDDLRTVGDVVSALACTYAGALEYYAAWQRRRWEENHYRTRGRSDVANTAAGFCAVRASLRISGPKIKEAFEGGVDVFGADFAVGDDICRLALQDSLERLWGCIDTLQRAVDVDDCPLELHGIVGVSESVRAACLAALSKQYQRVAVGRLVPRGLPRSQRQSWLDVPTANEAVSAVGDDDDDDAQPAYRILAGGGGGGGGGGGKSPFHSEPPSPPPTPKMVPDDLQSTFTAATLSLSSSSWGLGPRPKNSVFSVFCPEAMTYQVDPRKPLPEGDDGKCGCGYDWNGKRAREGAAATVTVLNDGFQITPRFLGKSHCGEGFGCVLCTSRGKTETYENVEDLRDHINASHTKWQLLHDRDMVGR